MAKRSFAILLALATVFAVLVGGYWVVAQSVVNGIKVKGARVEAGLDVSVKNGRNPEPVLVLLKQVQPALDKRQPATVEALLDRALELLGASAPGEALAAVASVLPVVSVVEAGTDLYINPQPVTIEGYDGSAMEPFIAPDGRSLFFNNLNDPGVDTNLHIATRIGTRVFRYAGEVDGQELFFHRKIDGRFVIYRAERHSRYS